MKDFLTYITESNDPVKDKMYELNDKLYSNGYSRERRLNGYIMSSKSDRKCRFIKTSDETNFYIEVVNKSDESFVADIGDCMSKTIDELIEIIEEY